MPSPEGLDRNWAMYVCYLMTLLCFLEHRNHCVNLSFFFFLTASSMAYGDSQARGLIGAASAGLRHNHSNAGSKPHLRPTPQLMATPEL